MTYDAVNRVVSTSQRFPLYASPFTLYYSYDANGNRTRMTTPWGDYTYSYDNLNRLISLTNPDAKTVTFAYDAIGRRTKMALPNGTETTYAYDGGSQLTQVLHRNTADNTAIAFANYAYDPAGNRTSMTDPAGTHSYGYDDLHRLVSATHPPLSAVTVKEETFNYDAVGNRTADAVITNYQHNAANRLLENSSYSYTYDLNGNQTGQTAKADNAHTTYAYNSENQLISATMPDGTVVSYKYDPLGRRIEKDVTINASHLMLHYLYDNEDIIAVLDGNNNVISNFTHGPGIDEPLIMKSSTSENYYYHADGLGSITALTNETGAIVETIEYQAYGKPVFKDGQGNTISRSALGNIYSYTSREYDAETGLFYFRARYYNAEMGRFSQEDPIGFAGGDVNLYVYVENKPLVDTDSSGLLTDEAKRIVDYLETISCNASVAHGRASNMRDENDSLALRDAEHYLFAKAYVETASVRGANWLLISIILTPGYDAAKLAGLVPGATPPGWGSIAAGEEGAWAGLLSGKHYKWTPLWEDKKCKNQCQK
jgi:RHS repeat-associated protein